MLSTLTLATAILLQSPKPQAKPAPATKPAPKAAPAAKAAAPTTAASSTTRAAELRSTAQKRKDALAAKKANFKANRAREAANAREWAAYVERVGPVIAAQQREAWLLQFEAQRTAAMSAMAGAAQIDAATNRARLRLQSQQLGVPQVFVPGQGMVPYPGSTFGPIP